MLSLFKKIMVLLFLSVYCQINAQDFKILVFTKTSGFTHSSIQQGVDMLEQLGTDNNFDVDVTGDDSAFTLINLQQYGAVVFLSTTGDVLNDTQQTAFELYIKGGGGYVGIHAASDTEYDWPWYADLVGAYFSDHPPGTHEADVKVSDRVHPSTENLPFSWTRTDEWYNFATNPRGNVHVLATLDETSYEGGTMGYDHPIIWCHEYDGGRSWYTAGGHTAASFSEPLFVEHVLGGIRYAAHQVDGNFDATVNDNFEVSVIENSPSNPMALSILPDNRVLYIERSGNIKLYDPTNGTINTAASFEVDSNREDGLIGIVLDPNFETNNWLYIFYSPAGDDAVQHVSRLTFSGNTIDPDSEEIIMVIPVQREECCHSGGDLEFDKEGNLYIALGDNINPFSSNGYAPIDERTYYLDAQGTSANTKDYRGKILRIKPEDDGTYSIPQGNLFTDANEGYPEIYTMGHRNPFRFTVGPDGYLYVGEVGPDSNVNSNNRGPRGYDEFNRTNVATNFGWPYCIADNQSYVDYDFETGISGDNFDCDNPVNTSPNNTGATNLPPASSAWIWYHDGETTAFPAMGTGSGRTAMAGDVYEYNEASASEVKFPEYYDNSIFIYEWSRNWIREVKVDDAGNIVSINPFLDNLDLNRPIDMDFGPDGAMYIIEWGTGFGGNNADARIIKVSYKNGNRTPNAIATADPVAGVLPLTVNFDAQDSFDTDQGDNLTYEWDFDGDGTFDGSGVTISNTYVVAGTYSAQLKVTDNEGLSAFATVIITAGNSIPQVTIENPVNGGFFTWGEVVNFNISVVDVEDGNSEDGSIDCGDISALASIGHDDHSHDLNANENCEDSFTTQSHGDDADNVFYVIRGGYTDEGADGVDSITGTSTHILQPKRKEAEHFTSQQGIQNQETEDALGGGNNVGFIENGDYISFDPINLKDINHITFRASSARNGGYIEVRTDAVDGPLLGSRFIPSTGDWQFWDYFTMPIQDPGGTHELFFVFTGGGGFLLNLNWIEFHGQGIANEDSNALKGLTASYFNSNNFTGTPIITKDPMIAFNWEDNSPVPGINSDNYSVRWEGYLTVEETGNYNLRTEHTGGAVSVEINGTSVINETTDGVHTSNVIALTAEETHSIVVEYVKTGDSGAISLGWGQNQTIYQSNFNTDGELPSEECEDNDAFSLIEAEDYCEHFGIETDDPSTYIGWIEDGDWVMYQNFDFGSGGFQTISALVSSATTGGTIEVRHHGVEGSLLGTIEVENTGGWEEWQTVSGDIVSEITGIHPLYLVFRGGSGYLLNVDWFQFEQGDTVDPTNLALDGQASQSSNYSSVRGLANLAIDGNTNGNWNGFSVTHTQSITNSWWQVVLQEQTNIGDIVIYNRIDTCCIERLSNFTVSVLNSDNVEVYSETITTTPNPSITINTEGVSGQTIRITNNLNNTPLSLAEVEVYEGDDPSASCTAGTNLSLNATIADFSAEQNTTNAVSNILDGLTENRWSASTFPQYATIDLGDVYDVDEINLTGYQNRDYQFIVEGSLTSTSSGFGVMVDATDNTDQGIINRTFSNQLVRYVKLTVLGANTYNGNWSSITNFEILCAGSESKEVIVDSTFEITSFPIPFSNEINVTTNDTDQIIGSFQLLDITGKLIKTQLVNTKQGTINNLDSLAKGMYFLKVLDSENQTLKLIKLIK